MVIGENMENQNYLMVQNNVVINVCVWNGDTEQWQPPSDVLMLIQATTPAFNWVWNSATTEWELQESVGGGSLNDTWNGTACVTSQPKPEKPVQPTTSGTQTL